MSRITYTINLLAALVCIPAIAMAQEEIEEVIVTAIKREATIREVPFSLNAQTQRDIQRRGMTNIEDVSRNVAALTVQNLGPGQSQVAIRGVSAGQLRRDQPGVKEQVGIYMDESVVSLSLFTPDLDLYDLNRVETLRGPQGTLFGSGSVGGTIRYISNQPVMNETLGSVELDLNTITDGETGGHLKGMVNQPISDTAALRLVGFTTSYGGFIDALGENGSRKEDVNSGYRSGARLAVTWEPTENVKLTPRYMYQRVGTDGLNRQEVFNLFANPYTTTRPAITLGEREQYLLLDEEFEDTFKLFDFTAEIDLAGAQLISITSIQDRDILVGRDASALTNSVSVDLNFPENLIPLPSNLLDTTEFEQFTQELRLASTGDSRFQWLFGMFYSDIQREYAQHAPTPGHDAALDSVRGAGTSDSSRNGFPQRDHPYVSDVPYDIEQFAVFGELSYAFTDRLTFTAGARLYDFEENRRFDSGGFFSNQDNRRDQTESDGFNPRFLVAYEVNDNITWNAQASTGFRLGGVNDPLNQDICTPEDVAVFGGFQSYEDETSRNYETGFKAAWANGLRLNLAVFHSDIEDLQVNLEAGDCSSRVSINVEDAHTTGLEFELSLEPVDGLELSLAGSFLESEFDSTFRDINGNVLGGLESGNRLASVPELQLAAAALYTIPVDLFGGSELYFSASVQHVSDRYTQPSDQVAGAGVFRSALAYAGATGMETAVVDLDLDPYTLVNLRAGLSMDSWEVALYINNATDENANLSFDRERGGRARLAFRTNQPRTVGVVLRKFFN